MKIVYENVSDRLQTILSRLKGVKKVGENTYRAYSPLRDEKEPSLYITEKPDGIILMCDHGGGKVEDILAAIGLTMRILFPDGGSSGSEPKGSDPERKVAAIYQYLDKNGELVAEKVRYTNKTFFWRSKKPDGSYDYHKPKNVPLYNGTVLEKTEAVFLVEGEKDVDTLTKYGLPAVSLPNGAHWENEYVAYFSDKVIIILPDNDGAGRGYAKAALKALKPTNYNTGGNPRKGRCFRLYSGKGRGSSCKTERNSRCRDPEQETGSGRKGCARCAVQHGDCYGSCHVCPVDAENPHRLLHCHQEI